MPAITSRCSAGGPLLELEELLELDELLEPEELLEPDEPLEPEEPLEPDEPLEPEEPLEPDEPLEPEEPLEADEPLDRDDWLELLAPGELLLELDSRPVELDDGEELLDRSDDELLDGGTYPLLELR